MVRRLSAQPHPGSRDHRDALGPARRVGCRARGRSDPRSVARRTRMRLFSIALLLVPALTGAPLILKVQISSPPGIVEIPLETYVAAVLAGESGGFQSSEALKAMAVAARTYAVRMRGRHSAEGFDLCDTTHCQRLDC